MLVLHARRYECADGRFVAVGALEPAFYKALVDGLQVKVNGGLCVSVLCSLCTGRLADWLWLADSLFY